MIFKFKLKSNFKLITQVKFALKLKFKLGKVKQFKVKTGLRKQVSFVGIDISDLTNSRSELR